MDAKRNLFRCAAICTLSFSACACPLLHAAAYAPMPAEIPVSCLPVTDADTHTYEIELKPEQDRAAQPMPAENTLLIAENGTGAFRIEVTEPGTYLYQIREIAGTDSGITYDSTVYHVTLFVENGDTPDTLRYAVSAAAEGKTDKSEQIAFQDEVTPAETTTVTTTTAAATTEPVLTTASAVTETTAATSATTVTTKKRGLISSLATGDSAPVALLIGILLTAAGVASVMLLPALRRRQREQR